MTASIELPKETAQKLDKEKRALEAQLAASLRTVFNDMADDAEALYAARGNLDSRELAENYRIEFLSRIRSAYRKTIKKFGFEIRDSIQLKHFLNFDIEYKKQLIDLDYKQTVQIRDEGLPREIEQVNTQFQEDMSLFIANQSEQQADIITNTNASEIEKAIGVGVASYAALVASKQDEIADISQELLVEESQPKRNRLQRRLDRVTNEIDTITREQQAIIAKSIKDKIKQDGVARSELIGTQEVGLAESFSRNKEAELIDEAGLVSAAGQPIETFKEWVAILDNRTREAHVRADGQRVPTGQPFIVDGEQLQFPRDPNGSAANVINCRCVSMFQTT
jgi:uncharacterized protein with gpF-like domain